MWMLLPMMLLATSSYTMPAGHPFTQFAVTRWIQRLANCTALRVQANGLVPSGIANVRPRTDSALLEE